MLEIVLPNLSRSQLCVFFLPIKVISDAASQDYAAPDLTFRGFNIQPLKDAVILSSNVHQEVDVCGFTG